MKVHVGFHTYARVSEKESFGFPIHQHKGSSSGSGSNFFLHEKLSELFRQLQTLNIPLKEIGVLYKEYLLQKGRRR